MRRILNVSFCLLFFTFTLSSFGQTPNPTWDPNGTYTLMFDDEFNATSVDISTWELGWYLGLGNTGISDNVNSAEIACYDSSNVTEPGDGYLHMRLTTANATCRSSKKPYTGALVDTRPTFNQVGGSFEARVFLPGSKKGCQVAAWPAWWQNGPDSIPWPTHGEIDTVEGLGGSTSAHLHYTDGSGVDQGPGFTVTPPQIGWHTFGERRDATAQTVTFYYDGVQVWTHAFTATAAEYLVFDYTIESGSPKPKFPSEMLVDWVRVWN